MRQLADEFLFVLIVVVVAGVAGSIAHHTVLHHKTELHNNKR